jgi:hypothetical protein
VPPSDTYFLEYQLASSLGLKFPTFLLNTKFVSLKTIGVNCKLSMYKLQETNGRYTNGTF